MLHIKEVVGFGRSRVIIKFEYDNREFATEIINKNNSPIFYEQILETIIKNLLLYEEMLENPPTHLSENGDFVWDFSKKIEGK